jgi:hypothetical protein
VSDIDLGEEAAIEERVGWYVTIAGDPTGAGHHLVRAQELAESGDIADPMATALRAGVAVPDVLRRSGPAHGCLLEAGNYDDALIAEMEPALARAEAALFGTVSGR